MAGNGRDMCGDYCLHDDLIETVRSNLGTQVEIMRTADFYKLLGSETRLKIIFALQQEELCVCDIAAVVGLSLPATSQQLKMLRLSGLLTLRNAGRVAYYSLSAQTLPQTIRDMMAQFVYSQAMQPA